MSETIERGRFVSALVEATGGMHSTALQLAAALVADGWVLRRADDTSVPDCEWTWRHNDYIAEGAATTDYDAAEAAAAHVRAANPGHDVVLMTRQVTGWAAVSEASSTEEEN